MKMSSQRSGYVAAKASSAPVDSIRHAAMVGVSLAPGITEAVSTLAWKIGAPGA